MYKVIRIQFFYDDGDILSFNSSDFLKFRKGLVPDLYEFDSYADVISFLDERVEFYKSFCKDLVIEDKLSDLLPSYTVYLSVSCVKFFVYG